MRFGDRESDGPVFFVVCLFIFDECAFFCFSKVRGFALTTVIWGVGSWQESGKGTQDFSSAMGVPRGRAREKTVSITRTLLPKRLVFHTGPCHQFR
jgi:hypothetical protein